MPEQPTDTTVLLTTPIQIPGTRDKEPAVALVFAGAGKHHIDEDRTLHVQSLAGGNLASFADGRYVGVYHGSPAIAPAGDDQ